MLTIPEAARLLHRNAGTLHRWIREGRLPLRMKGGRRFLEEGDIAALEEARVPLPAAWRRTATGEPMPDILAALRSSRSAHQSRGLFGR